jgi:hypothetical protein
VGPSSWVGVSLFSRFIQVLTCFYSFLVEEIIMRKRRDSGGRFGAAAVIGLALLCLTVGGLTGCKQDGGNLSGENKITSFKIGGSVGFIADTGDAITIKAPAIEDVKKLKPDVVVSANASVYPPSGAEVDISYPRLYTVTAENGDARGYTVTVIPLDYIEVSPVKTWYAKGDAWEPEDVVVTGYYSDGSNTQEVTGYKANVETFQEEGSVAVVITLNDKTAVYEVNVITLVSIYAMPLKSTYANGEEFNAATDLSVVGTYSDGTTKILTSEEYTVTLDADPEPHPLTSFLNTGNQTLLITANGKTDTVEIRVEEKHAVEITIGLPNEDGVQPVIFGVPPEGIVLSVDGRPNGNGKPNEIIISAGGHKSGSDGVYTNVAWYIDNTLVSSANILTIKAADGSTPRYALHIPHTITFVGTRNGVVYSKTITFKVER